jgi:hypothetical protein
MLLARNFSSNKSINNAVESFFQSLLDLGGAGSAVWGTMNKGSEELDWTHHHQGQETWLLRRFHGEQDRRKCDSKNFFEKHSACVLCAVRKYWLWNAGRWARRWTVKLVRDSGRVPNGATKSVDRPEGELQWQANVGRVRPSRTSGFCACQVLWPIAGRSASRAAVCRASSLMCATQENV